MSKCFVIIFFVVPIIAVAQQNDSIMLKRFYPEYFSEVKTGFEIVDDTCNNCYPQDPDLNGKWTGILINCPKKIYYFPGVDTIPNFPYCSYEKESCRRFFLYAFDYKICVKKIEENFLIEDILSYETRLQRVKTPDVSSITKMRHAFKTKLNIALRNDNSLITRNRSINIFNYLDLPFKSGLYDVYIQYCDYESNHEMTEIIFANEKTLFYPEAFNNLKLGFQFDRNRDCHPQLPPMQMPFKQSFFEINIPSEIYHYPKTDTTTIFPICSTSEYLLKDDILKQGNIVEIFIKNIDTNKIYKSKVDFDGRDSEGKTDTEYVINYPKTKKEQKEKAAEIEEGSACLHAFNINALDFVDMPYEAGIYEVYVKRAGYESNHMKVTIKFFYEK